MGGSWNGFDYTEAQTAFLKSKHTNKPYAMLLEGVWWENEAEATFIELENLTGEKKSDRRFGLLPMPKVNAEAAGPQTMFSSNSSFAFINKDCQNMQLAKEFMRFLHTDAEMSKFSAKTSIPRSLKYEVSEEDKATATYFGKSMIDMRKSAQVVYPYSSLEMVINNAAAFTEAAWYLNASVDGKTWNNPFEAFKDTNKTLTSPRIKYTVNGSSKSISISTSTKSPVSIAKVDGIDPSSFVFSGRYNIASSIAENVRFDIPIYKFASHTITYDLKDGVQNSSNVASYDSSSLPVTLAEPTKYGHYFMGWYDDEGNRVLSINNTDAGDVHLTAKWQAIPYTLTIDDGHGNINKITYKFGEQIATPSNPANVEGYEFAGWDKEIPSVMPNNDLVITAKWTKIETPVDNQEESGCGCGCGCNSAIVMTLTGILAIGLIVLRKKH